MSAPAPQAGILDISPYVPGQGKASGEMSVIKLSSNESALGPSPRAVAAFRDCATDLARYPDGSATTLRSAIQELYGIDAGRIVCGAGSDEILGLLAQAYLGPGDEAIHTRHGFLVYPIVTRANGATPVVAEEVDKRADADAVLACVTPRTRIVFLANPNNPTGTYAPIDEVRRLRAELREDILLVLDAAYAEFVRRNDYEAGMELVATTENTVMTRTFSKIHGLAALRLGWAYCPAGIADVLNRIRGPFNVSAPAIAAGTAALSDTAHIQAGVEHNGEWLARLAGELAELGLDVTPSVANFLLLNFPDGDSGRTAAAADAFLRARGIFLRRMDAYGLPGALRLSIGTAEENTVALQSLGEFMAGAGTPG